VSHAPSEFDPVEEVAEEFLERYRRGERPSLTEYAARYPHLADRIRKLFPALVVIEEVGSLGGGKMNSPAGTALPDGQVVQQLGEYRLIREVGRGGMGVVYEAVQESLGRHVALKVLPFHAALTPTHLERFRREAHAAAQLHHTNIVPVFGVGEQDGLHYYAMQFIQGQGLDTVLRELRNLRPVKGKTAPGAEGPTHASVARSVADSLISGAFGEPGVPTVVPDGSHCACQFSTHTPHPPPLSAEGRGGQEVRPGAELAGSTLSVAGDASALSTTSQVGYFHSVARVAVQVAEALAHAHHLGIVHRDIKPSNLLLDTHGTVWVTDFGLAKTADAGELTEPGDVIGTLRYMAPERFKGVTDVRGDVYSLGATLFEMATLRPPFADADRFDLMRRVPHEAPLSPRKIDGRIPRDLETIILKAMDRDPARRFQTAAALADELRLFLADRPIRARRTAAWEQFWRWCRRNPAVASLAAAVSLLLVAVAVVSTVSALRLRQEEQATRYQLELTTAAEASAQGRLYEALLAQARASRLTRRPGQRFDGLRAIREALKLPLPPGHSLDELRNEAIACLLLPDFEVGKEWEGWPVGSSGLAFDARFERYARGDKDGNVTVRRVADDRELLTLPGAGAVSDYDGLAFSPDGRFLRQRCQTPQGWRSRLWKLDGPRPVRLLDDAHAAAAFRPDGHGWAVYYPDGTVRVYDAPSGKESRWRVRGMGEEPHLRWNPRRPLLAVVGSVGSHGVILDGRTGRVEWEFPGLGVEDGWIDWHPDGRLLAVGSNSDRRIRLWDVDTRELVLPPLEGHQTPGLVLRFSPSGDELLSTDWSGLWRLWEVRSGRLLLTVPAGGPSLQFDASRTLVAADATPPRLRIFRYQRGNEFRTLLPHRGARMDAAGFWRGTLVSDQQGRLLAVNVRDRISLVDLERGVQVGHVHLPGNSPLVFEPSGALLTNGSAGVLRWPVTAEPLGGRRRYGPPEEVYSAANEHAYGASADCRVLAMPHFGESALILHRDGPRYVPLGPQEDVRCCAVSPDGRWVATGSHELHEGAGAMVWEARTGRHEADLPVAGVCTARFSPDGKWLATGGGGARLWEVATWRPGPVLSGPRSTEMAFSPDSRLVAVRDDPGVVRLFAPTTGREVARLTAPVECPLSPQCFTPDGTRLITLGGDHAVHVFDLAAVRRQLRALGLDWELPAYEPAAARQVQPVTVEVDYGYLRGREKYSLILAFFPFYAEGYYRRGLAHLRFAEQPAARADFSTALLLKPDLADAAYQRGLIYAQQARHTEAVADFSRTLALRSGHADAHGQRGAAFGQLQEWDRAAADFDVASARNPGRWEYGVGRAVAHLAKGDEAGYRAASAAAVARFRTTDNLEALTQLCWACALAPRSGVDTAELVRQAERAHAGNRGQYTYLRNLGVCLYRAGRFEEALRRLQEAAKAQADSPMTWLLLALVHQRLGHADEAARWFRRARPRVDAILKGDNRPLLWIERAGLCVLRREVDAVLSQPTRPSPRRAE
jgi:serine/threonine protein kinase/WD40 repeat protein/tetratricopeptide (TPR) repeat protein